MSPLVSVVIPTFNRRDQVLQALESIANQSYPHLEALVADDASTDDTSDTWTLVALIGRLAHPDVREWAYTTRAALTGVRRETVKPKERRAMRRGGILPAPRHPT